VARERIYTDRGLTGTIRTRPGLDQALAACRAGDTFTVTKLDRLARSVPDALIIFQQLADRGVLFALGASVHDWNDPFARMFLQVLAVIAEFEANLIRHRTREGMAIAKANGKLRGKKPKLPESAQRTIRRRYATGEVSLADLAEEYRVGRSTIHRIIHTPATPEPRC
jgi:DNA invertase Pin-like site-specific DNA recombinase